MYVHQGSARQLFERLQGPNDEENLKAHFEKIILLMQQVHARHRQVISFPYLHNEGLMICCTFVFIMAHLQEALGVFYLKFVACYRHNSTKLTVRAMHVYVTWYFSAWAVLNV